MAISAGVVACTDDASTCELDPESILITAAVTDDLHGVQGDVRLYLENSDGLETSLRLCREQGDLLTLNGASLTESSVDGLYQYTATLNGPTATYTFRFTRGGKAYTLDVDAPPDLEIATPTAGQEFSAADALPMTWSPEWLDNTLDLRAIPSDPTCLQSLQLDVDDVGAAELPAGALVLPDAVEVPPTCPVTLQLRRVNPGVYPEGLAAGGWIEARMVAQVVAVATP